MRGSEALALAYPELLIHFAEALPQEAVGFVMWDGCVLRLFNQAQSNHRFWINSQQVRNRLEYRGYAPERVLCIYHTHPERPAKPSGEDRRFMLELVGTWPHVVHLILSRDESCVYAVMDGKIERLPWQRSHSLPVN